LEIGLLNAEHYLFQALTSLLFHRGYASIKECEEITSLVGVSCMKRRKMKALFESFLEEEEEED
jgi:hypothetical protein